MKIDSPTPIANKIPDNVPKNFLKIQKGETRKSYLINNIDSLNYI